MNGFELFHEKVKKYDVNKILNNVWNNFKVREYIIKLNTEGLPTSQLYNEGIDSLGVKLGEYTPYTVQIKLSKNQRVDHITLRDTGGFYESFTVKPNSKGFTILANPIMDDGTNLMDRFGKEIEGLTDENIKILTEFIAPFYVVEAKKILS
jgi:hypothetical protein